MDHQALLARLWKDYISDNPHAYRIYHLLTQRGEHVINDHIALRTCNDPRVNIEILSRPFIASGYYECGNYSFVEKKLKAKHYEHPNPLEPKIFISELLLEQCSATLSDIITEQINHIPQQRLDSEGLLFSGTSWLPLSYTTYQTLLAESEYAAWLYAYGFRANHFTVNVNALRSFQDMHALNTFLKEQGFTLNTSGGEIKGGPQEYLEQSSTLAETKHVLFGEESHPIPCCYYEFAKRYVLPNGKIFQGFVTQSANKIFESTDNKKK